MKRETLKRIVAIVLVIVMLPVSEWVDTGIFNKNNSKTYADEVVNEAEQPENVKTFENIITLESKIGDKGEVCLKWNDLNGNNQNDKKNYTYLIFRDNKIIASTNDIEYSDYNTESDGHYTYKVIVYLDENGVYGTSQDVSIDMPGDLSIDKYLASKIDFSRETITKMLAEEYILVNGKSIKASYKVKVGDVILIKDGFVKEMTLEATKMDIDIVFEDEYLMVINKDSGVVVHPGAGNNNNTLVNGLLYYNKTLSKGEEFRPGVVHRLDKDTSGLMIIAKDDKAHELLADDFKNKRIHREYIALLDGVFPQEKAVIDAPIGRSKQYFDKMEVCKDGKKAITNLEVIKKYKDYTLVRLVLETGRTHQIRVHLAYIGYPVHNDPVYSNKSCTDFGQFLHSAYLRFKHPITGELLEFNSDLPKEFQDFIDNL